MLALRWSPRARRELNAALARIAEHDAERAAAMYARIDQATAHLRNHPVMGRPGRIPWTRELVISRTPFIAVYIVERGVVRIKTLNHAARNGQPSSNARADLSSPRHDKAQPCIPPRSALALLRALPVA